MQYPLLVGSGDLLNSGWFFRRTDETAKTEVPYEINTLEPDVKQQTNKQNIYNLCTRRDQAYVHGFQLLINTTL